MDVEALSAFGGSVNAKDLVGLLQLQKAGNCRDGKHGTTALMMGQLDVTPHVGKPFPCTRIRIKSGPEKDQIAYIMNFSIDILIPTRVKVGQTGVLAHESTLPPYFGSAGTLWYNASGSPMGVSLDPTLVNVYARVETFDEYVRARKNAADQSGNLAKIRGDDELAEYRVDKSYADAGSLLVLPTGVRVKVLGFITPGDHPSLSQTLVHVEFASQPKGRKKSIIGKKGYVLAFDIYTRIDGSKKGKRNN